MHECAKRTPHQERTQSGPLADPERTQSEPLADQKRTQIFKKRTRSGPKANLRSAFGVRFGVRLGPFITVYLDVDCTSKVIHTNMDILHIICTTITTLTLYYMVKSRVWWEELLSLMFSLHPFELRPQSQRGHCSRWKGQATEKKH